MLSALVSMTNKIQYRTSDFRLLSFDKHIIYDDINFQVASSCLCQLSLAFNCELE